MKRAMLLTVGTGPGVEHAVFFSIKQHNPDYVVLCASSTTNPLLDLIKGLLGEGWGEDFLLIDEFAEINDFEKLFHHYTATIGMVIRKGYEASELVADYTSGTKAMSAALTAAAIDCNIGSLSYVYSDRRDKDYGRSQTGGMKVSSLSPHLIYSRQRLQLARQFFNQYRFEAVISLLIEPHHPEVSEEALWLTQLAQAYDAWDKLNYEVARDQFAQLLKHNVTKQKRLTDLLEVHKKTTGNLASQCQLYNEVAKRTSEGLPSDEQVRRVLGHSLVKDLLDNASRRYQEGKYDDGSARLYRALELLGQIEFIKATGLANAGAPVEALPSLLQEKFTAQFRNGKIELPLMKTYMALEVLGCELGTKFMKQQKEWLKMLSKRNYSLLAHGLQPVGKNDYIHFRQEVSNLLPGGEDTLWPTLG